MAKKSACCKNVLLLGCYKSTIFPCKVNTFYYRNNSMNFKLNISFAWINYNTVTYQDLQYIDKILVLKADAAGLGDDIKWKPGLWMVKK